MHRPRRISHRSDNDVHLRHPVDGSYLYGGRRGPEGLATGPLIAETPSCHVSSVKCVVHEVLPDLLVRNVQTRSNFMLKGATTMPGFGLGQEQNHRTTSNANCRSAPRYMPPPFDGHIIEYSQTGNVSEVETLENGVTSVFEDPSVVI